MDNITKILKYFTLQNKPNIENDSYLALVLLYIPK